MGRGAAALLTRMHGEGRLDGVLGVGGSGGSSIVTTAMRALPVGVPKLMVSTPRLRGHPAVRRRRGRDDDVLRRRHLGDQLHLAQILTNAAGAMPAWSRRSSRPWSTSR
jgi:uncharacterized protein (UPF0261 family)